MTTPSQPAAGERPVYDRPVRERLLEAALDRFLADDYHNVTTRQIAARAGVNVSMIHYYFGNKEGLFEETIRAQLTPMLEVLDGGLLDSTAGFADFLRLYYDAMSAQPEFPKLILKILALHRGLGRRFVLQLLERERVKSKRKVGALQQQGQVGAGIDPDMVRMTFVSLAMTPMLLKELFEEQLGKPMDTTFLHELAAFNGRLLAAALAPP